MKQSKTNHQNGIALLSALMILLLLSAIATGLVMMTNTESKVNANYRGEQVLYFGAVGGIEEVRDRMTPSHAGTLVSPNCVASACLPANPVVPSGANQGILYVLGGTNPAAVTPWTAGSIYMDDELCHDGYGMVTTQSSDVRCTAVPGGAGWYASTTSIAPWNGTAAALPYQWVRVSWKLNGSVQGYPVDVATCPSAGAAGCSTPVCWDGSEEVLLPAGIASCSAMPNLDNPVYLLTSMAINPTSGSRKIVQAEVALPPPTQTTVAGFFATSTACGAMSMAGGATTDGFSSAHGGNYNTTKSNNSGSIGTNGNVNLDGNPTQVGGNIYAPNTTIGAACPPDGVTEVGGAGMKPGNSIVQQTAVTVPPPALPNPLPPTTNISPSSLVPGSYGNISVASHGTLTLAPGTYTINSISLAGNSTVTISPAGAVVINVAGQGTATPVNFTGGSLSNTSAVAANFQINYAGSGTVKLSGGSASYAVLNAPNAALQFVGNSDFYGSAIASTISDTGGTALHFDTSLQNNINSPATNYSEISLRQIAY